MSEQQAGDFDVVVVGAGVIGSSTAYHLAQEGKKKVLLLEQFSVLHTRGSSHGGSRITRRAYDQPYYVHMMDECFRLWKQLEIQSGVKLYTKTGVLVFGEECNVQSTISSLRTNNVDFEEFSGGDANKRWHQLKLPASYKCVYEKDGGILAPQKSVAAYQKEFVKRGGVLWEYCPVNDIETGDVVKLTTSRGIVSAKKVVFTVGPWAQEWMSKLELEDIKFKTKRMEVFYWKVEKSENLESPKFPVFLLMNSKDSLHPHFYGCPIHEYPGMMKISFGGPEIAHPDDRDANITSVYYDLTSDFIRDHFKDVSSQLSICETCITTFTSTGDPILDYHPKHKNIILGVGFSGHGFKLSPVIGKILCELSLDMNSSYDISPFRIN